MERCALLWEALKECSTTRATLEKCHCHVARLLVLPQHGEHLLAGPVDLLQPQHVDALKVKAQQEGCEGGGGREVIGQGDNHLDCGGGAVLLWVHLGLVHSDDTGQAQAVGEPVLDLVDLAPDEQRHLVKPAGVLGLGVAQLGPGGSASFSLS